MIQRPLRYAYLKLIRQEGAPEQISAGAALGVFIGLCTPMGPQMIVAFLLASYLRINRIAAVLGVWITNPITIPFLYPIQIWLGCSLAGITIDYQYPDSIADLWTILLNWRAHGELLLALVVGAVASAIISALATFFITNQIVKSYRAKKLQRQNERQKNAVEPESTRLTP